MVIFAKYDGFKHLLYSLAIMTLPYLFSLLITIGIGVSEKVKIMVLNGLFLIVIFYLSIGLISNWVVRKWFSGNCRGTRRI